MSLPSDYSTRVYAGVLGKIIGVYLGRPFEQWSHERIQRELGEIRSYVHDRLGKPLIVTDDDISGTFTFLRALADHGYDAGRLTSADIGHTWLNYILPHRTILWWGGVGVSSEHTAWYRLKSGIPAPQSGSVALNGTTVAAQIGAQIFIDGWGLICPGDPAQAASLAARAGAVSHDGTAIHGAQMVAAMVALAFKAPAIDALIEGALAHIPARCELACMIADVRRWHARDGNWRTTLDRIQRTYGYGIYPGGCHMIPNHALIVLALLYGEGDFNRSMSIVNTAGYDTDCNSGNVGCILAVRHGLAAFAGEIDWRGPVADRLYLPTADGGRTISDAVRETDAIVAAAHRMRGLIPPAPKSGARFHFSHPGSVQGFVADPLAAPLTLANPGSRLELRADQATDVDHPARALTATFPPRDAFTQSVSGYSLTACPTLYPGQTVKARLVAASQNAAPLTACLVAVTHEADGTARSTRSSTRTLAPGRAAALGWKLPARAGQPIAAIGVEFSSAAPARLALDSLTWSGAPMVRLVPASNAQLPLLPWVDACTGTRAFDQRLRIHHEDGLGFLAQGTRDWRDYTLTAELIPRLGAEWGLAVRWQGLERHVTVRFDGRRVRLVATLDGRSRTLAAARFAWPLETPQTVSIAVKGSTCTVRAAGKTLVQTHRLPPWLDGGAVALVVTAGCMDCTRLELA